MKHERLMRLAAVPGYLASRGPKPPSRSAVYAWVWSGKLEACKIGGIWHTSEEALQRSSERDVPLPEAEALAVGRQGRRATPKRLRKAHEEAEARLDAIGW